jgi:hypothetical protein
MTSKKGKLSGEEKAIHEKALDGRFALALPGKANRES